MEYPGHKKCLIPQCVVLKKGGRMTMCTANFIMNSCKINILGTFFASIDINLWSYRIIFGWKEMRLCLVRCLLLFKIKLVFDTEKDLHHGFYIGKFSLQKPSLKCVSQNHKLP